MTLNGIIALILRFFSPNSIALVEVIEDRPIVSVTYCIGPSSSLPLLAKIYASCSAVSLR